MLCPLRLDLGLGLGFSIGISVGILVRIFLCDYQSRTIPNLEPAIVHVNVNPINPDFLFTRMDSYVALSNLSNMY